MMRGSAWWEWLASLWRRSDEKPVQKIDENTDCPVLSSSSFQMLARFAYYFREFSGPKVLGNPTRFIHKEVSNVQVKF